MKFEPEHVTQARDAFERRLKFMPDQWRGPLVDVIDTIDNVKLGLESLGIDDSFILMEATKLLLKRQGTSSWIKNELLRKECLENLHKDQLDQLQEEP